jgi:hypothetical protein
VSEGPGNTVSHLFSLLVAVAFASGPPFAMGQSSPRYPAPISDFAQWERFPAECAGYHRGVVTAFAPALTNYSIAYARHDDTLQNEVTLYLYPRLNDRDAQLRAEEAEVMSVHPKARVVGRRSLVLERDGMSYEAALIGFEYDDLFAGTRQTLNSQLWVVFRWSGTFKVRSTAPIDQAALSEASVRQLLQCVAWAG